MQFAFISIYLNPIILELYLNLQFKNKLTTLLFFLPNLKTGDKETLFDTKLSSCCQCQKKQSNICRRNRLNALSKARPKHTKANTLPIPSKVKNMKISKT